MRSGVIRRQLCGDRGGSEEPSKLALTISWALAGPGSIPSVTPQGGHKAQTRSWRCSFRVWGDGGRGQGARRCEPGRRACNRIAEFCRSPPLQHRNVLRLHFGQPIGIGGKTGQIGLNRSAKPLLSHSKPLNKRNNFRMRGRLLPLCYPVRQGALSCGRGARSAPA